MSAPEASTDRPNILLVDDEPALLEAMRLNMEARFNVHTARSVAEAERLLAQERCDVVVTDHLMPNELGLNFLVRIKDRYPSMRRILVTGDMNPDLQSRAEQLAGLSACLIKPIRYTDIERAIRQALETPETERLPEAGEQSA